MKNLYAHIEKGIRALLAAVLGVTLCLPALPATAFADEEEPFDPVGHFEGIAPARFEDAPAVGTVIDLGFGWVTGLRCEGETAETGHVYFQMDFDDTYGIFGGPVRMDGLACMDRALAAAGGAYNGSGGRQSWPVVWLGRAWDTRFKASAVVERVDYEACAITYRINAYVVINNITDPGVTGYQRMSARVVVPYTPGGYAELLKVSANPDCTAGNPMYSLEGAVYGLYATPEDAAADENRIFTFTTDADGKTNRTDWIDAGTYYVKELSASKGYKVDEAIHPVSVVGGVNTFEVKEVPFSDPPNIWKVDADLNFDPTVEFDGSNNLPQGGATLAGAQFAVNYYAIDGTPSAVEVAALTPTRSWVIQSKATGYASVDFDCYVSGDDLYINDAGNPTVPLGVVSFTEIKAPEGYLLPENPPTYMVRITPDGPDYYDTGYSAVFVTDEVIKGQISVAKSLVAPGGSYLDRAALEGIQVQVILVSDTSRTLVETLTLDAEGKATTGLLPYGTYELIESPETLPQGIQPWAWTTALTEEALPIAHIDITEADTYEAFFTDFTTTTITVTKTDADTHETLPGAKFALYKVPAEALLIDRGNVTLNPEASWQWQFVSELTTGRAGSVGFNELPFGIYAVMETKAPTGYLTETQMADTDEPVLHVFTMDAAHGSVAFSVVPSMAFGGLEVR